MLGHLLSREESATRITAGLFRLLRRPLAEFKRLPEINNLQTVPRHLASADLRKSHYLALILGCYRALASNG